MATFIKDAERLMHEAPPGLTVEAFRDFFERVLVRLDQLQIKSAVDVDNLEAVCGLLEMAELVERFPQSSVEEARSLSRTLRIVLAETVQYTCLFVGDNRPVQPDANYSGLVTLPRPVRGPSSSALDRAFVTFNYDLALDFALTFHHHPVFYGLGGPRENAAVPLLKLHGSLNWARCTGCGALTVVPMPQLLGINGAFLSIRGRLNVIRSEVAFETLNRCSCGATGRREVGLAPPSVNKGLYYQSFKPAWFLAARELSEAEEIYIIGYSLPTSDLFFRDLFALALAGPARVKKIEVVNTYGAVAEAVKNMLGPKLKPLVQSSVAPAGFRANALSRQASAANPPKRASPVRVTRPAAVSSAAEPMVTRSVHQHFRSSGIIAPVIGAPAQEVRGAHPPYWQTRAEDLHV